MDSIPKPVQYVFAAAIFIAACFVLGPILGDLPPGLAYHYLHIIIGQPLGIEVPDAVSAGSTRSLKVEFQILLLSPGLYSGLFVGYQMVARPRDLWKCFVPSLIVMSPLILFCVVPNPGMLIARPMLLLLLSLTFPYSLIGAVLGWLTRFWMRNARDRGTLLTLAFLLMADHLQAYGPAIGHRYIVRRGIDVLDRGGNKDRFNETVLSYFAIADGAEAEDGFPVIGTRGINHFHNPYTSRNNKGLFTLGSRTFGKLGYIQFSDSVVIAGDLWTEALADYNSGRKTEAYHKLGRVAHLVTGDTYQPAHTHDDPHAPHMFPIGGDLEEIETYFDANTSAVTALGPAKAPITGALTREGVYAFGDITSKETYKGSVFRGQLTIPESPIDGQAVGFVQLPENPNLIVY